MHNKPTLKPVVEVDQARVTVIQESSVRQQTQRNSHATNKRLN
jgi:hypothetical protein